MHAHAKTEMKVSDDCQVIYGFILRSTGENNPRQIASDMHPMVGMRRFDADKNPIKTTQTPLKFIFNYKGG